MSYNSMLKKVRDALLTISGLNSYHYFAPAGHGDPYVVWMEGYEGSSLEADDRKAAHSISGTIDLYTKTEFDPLVDSIHDALTAAKIGFYLESVQFEDDTKYIHYEWIFNV